MTKPLKVTILDDDPNFSGQWAAQIREVLDPDVEVNSATEESVRSSLGCLNSRRSDWCNPSGIPVLTDSRAALFDDVDVVIIDYNVRQNLDLASTNGITLAHLVRTCSTAKCVVVANQYEWRLDLSRVVERDELTFADFAFTTADGDLCSSWLWKRVRRNDSAPPRLEPVDWPTLRDWPNHVHRLAAHLLASEWIQKDQTDLELMPKEVRAEIGQAAWERLLPLGSDADQFRPEVLSWKTLRKSPWVAERKEAGVRRPPEIEALQAAAAILRWIRTTVLPPQDVLVDRYRLAERLGLPKDGDPIEAQKAGDVEQVLGPPTVGDILWPGGLWIWPRIQALVWEQRNDSAVDLVLLEDVSRFSVPSTAKTVRTRLDGAFSRRWISAGAPWASGPRMVGTRRA